MLLTTGFTEAQPGNHPATPPATPPGHAGHSTGGIWAKGDDLTLKLNFNARGGSEVKGLLMYSDSEGAKFMGDVDFCYFQEGNKAVFAGSVRKGNVDEDYFKVEVQDNGEGIKKTNPDRVSVSLTEGAPNCALSGDFSAQVTRGNLQVHD